MPHQCYGGQGMPQAVVRVDVQSVARVFPTAEEARAGPIQQLGECLRQDGGSRGQEVLPACLLLPALPALPAPRVPHPALFARATLKSALADRLRVQRWSYAANGLGSFAWRPGVVHAASTPRYARERETGEREEGLDPLRGRPAQYHLQQLGPGWIMRMARSTVTLCCAMG